MAVREYAYLHRIQTASNLGLEALWRLYSKDESVRHSVLYSFHFLPSLFFASPSAPLLRRYLASSS